MVRSISECFAQWVEEELLGIAARHLLGIFSEGGVEFVTSRDYVPAGDEGKSYRCVWETRNAGREMSVKWENFC